MYAYEVFQKYFKGATNFITPNPEEYFWLKNNLVIELSSGSGINYEPIYGVTVLFYNNGDIKRTKLDSPFKSRKSALRYIAKL